MFARRKSVLAQRSSIARRPRAVSLVESLEDRRLLSASVHHAVHHTTHHVKHATLHASKTTSSTTSTGSSTSSTSSDAERGPIINSLAFSLVPTAVQTGLKTLAAKDRLAVPADTDTVYLGNGNGAETYSMQITSTGTITRITVDSAGAPVTAPTQSTSTWATLSGTAAGSDAATAAEISAIATALTLAAPTSTTNVDVTTNADGTVVYTVRLSSSSTTTSTYERSDDGRAITVDSSGNPVGNQDLPFSVIPSKIQAGINAHLPTGATALATSSTQTVNVRTANGATTYSTTFTTSGISTTVTVDSTGTLATLPSESTKSFSDIPLAAQTELQKLATAEGVSGTIGTSQTVQIYDEGNGTVIYTVTLSATDSTTSQTLNVTISSDENGNPTVPPNGRGGGGCGGGDFGGAGFDGFASGQGLPGYEGNFAGVFSDHRICG